jgi:maltose alpha-D-glucosyltransferase/alpha-amylase
MTETTKTEVIAGPDLLWYKDAIIYQLHVRAFFDSNADGIGDLPGLIQKLDYLADLGVTAIWLLPFYPSPLKDDGYDIADYTNINPSYGTLKDFQTFLQEAHRRGLKVITELVINHTSDQHDWFQKSRRAKPGDYWRDFYVWSDDPNKYKGVRIIFKDFEHSNWTYDPVAKSYYWHRFYSHQPDLNFDNPEVHKAVFSALDFWMDMGVDGLRLDAVPYLFEREGTSCENLPETHEFLKKLRAHVEAKYPGRMLLAEANQWPEDAVNYFGNGDECHMNFHFPLMPRLFMALKMEDRYSIIDILKQTPQIPDNCQWATFLRNHDELTLEMVTDEERDYMYKVYAADPRARINLGVRRRLAPLVQNDRRQIELLNGLLFSLPGSPIIYYGDEIGMGDNIYLGDRDGVRTPFQWSPDRNAGFSKANPQSLYLPVIISPEYNSEALNVETLHANPNSLLWWMKKMIALRRTHPELSRGKLEFIENNNPRVLTYQRQSDESTIVCVANLSRTTQYVELDLSKFKGSVPVELFGHTDFPPIGDLPYFLTLSPYSFYWFQIVEKTSVETGQWLLRQSSTIEASHAPLHSLKERDVWMRFERGLRSFLPRMRWFAGKGRKISNIAPEDLFFVTGREQSEEWGVAVMKVTYSEGLPEHYVLGISYAEGDRAQRLRTERPDMIIAESFKGGASQGVYYDAILDGTFSQTILNMVLNQQSTEGTTSRLEAQLVQPLPGDALTDIPDPTLSGLEQSNSSVLFGKRYYLKIYRRVEEGENPEVEIGKFLTAREFKSAAPMVGALSIKRRDKIANIAIVQQVVQAEMDGWSLMVNQVGQVAEQALADAAALTQIQPPRGTLADLRNMKPPEELQQIAGVTIGLARQLGVRTAEMHIALGTEDRNAAFIPEAFTPFHQRSVFQSFRNLTDRVITQLKKARASYEGAQAEMVETVLSSENDLLRRFSFMKDVAIDASRTRIHGDYHLGQVLASGADFYIVDFEGEPARGLGERRLKRSPLKDVAGMIRSFDYAAEFYLKERVLRDEDRKKLQPVLQAWAAWVSSEFLNAYLDTMGENEFLPRTGGKVNLSHVEQLLDVFILEKALYEVGYELRSRPQWVDIPLNGVLNILRKRSI